MAFAPVKGERPEWVVQKLTELGIDRIVPLRSERSVVRWTGRARAGHGRAAAPGGPRGGGPVPARLAARGGRHRRLRRAGARSVAPGEVRPGPAERGPAHAGPAGRGGRARGWVEHATSWASGLPTVGFGLSVLRAETAAVTAGALMASLRTGTVAAEGRRRTGRLVTGDARDR